jgi:hypothetical protein
LRLGFGQGRSDSANRRTRVPQLPAECDHGRHCFIGYCTSLSQGARIILYATSYFAVSKKAFPNVDQTKMTSALAATATTGPLGYSSNSLNANSASAHFLFKLVETFGQC